MKFKIKATQPDGSISQGSKINVNFSNGKEIKLIESAPGIYTGEYIPNSKDIGTLKMNIVAKDLYENKGEILDTIIYIKQTSIIETGIFLFYQNIIRRYWWGILLFLIIAGILYKPSIEIDYLSKKLRRVKKEIKIINEMQVAAEKKYYKERSINKDEFLELMREYEKRLAKAQETEKFTRGTLNNKIEKIK